MSGRGEPILHVVVPGFYAAVERRRLAEPDARPILVGGDPRKRGRVQSASADAIDRGVAIGMTMLEALELCPDARRVASDMAHYRAVSGALRASLRREVEAIEPDGLGAAFLDPRAEPAAAERIATSILGRVEAETGLVASVGGGPSKGVARLAAESVRPGGVRIVAPGEVTAFLDPLPVGRLPGVGPRTAVTLARLGAQTVGELRRLPPETVEEALGNHGLDVLARAAGRDREGVKSSKHPASLSREKAFDPPAAPAPAVEHAVSELAGALESNLGRYDLRADRIALRLRLPDGAERTRSATVAAGLQTASEIAGEARLLLGRFELGSERVRGIRLTVAGLSPAGSRGRQLDLFG